jgi:tetratricopeptide (TPR) repeat protein
VALFLVLNKTGPNSLLVGGEGKFYIYLHPFENQTREKSLPQMLDYLIMENLDQFDQFKVINKEAALSLLGNNADNVDLQALKNKHRIDIKLELKGKISKNKHFYTIDAQLIPLNPGKKGKPVPITTTGKYKNSFLSLQIDRLIQRIYNELFPRTENKVSAKSVASVFGNEWQLFSNVYAGIRYKKRVELVKAEAYFLKAGNLLISKYFLADSYYFDGRRKEALALIDEIKPHIHSLTPALALKVNALEAQLKFEFTKQIKFLKELQKQFPFSKEVHYQLGEAYFHIANPKEAIPHYLRALELDPNYSQALNHLGYCYAYLGKHDDAIKVYEKCRNLDQSANSFDSLGDGYFYAGDLVNAEAMKERAVVPDENNKRISWPYQTLAEIYILKAQYKKAENALDDYKKINPSPKRDATVLTRKAFIQYQETNYDEALKLIDQSLNTFNSTDINDSTAGVYWLKGLILLELDKLPQSKEQLKWLETFKNTYHLDENNFKSAYKYYVHLNALIAEREKRIDDAEAGFKQLLQMRDRLSYWITYDNYQYFHSQYALFLSRNRRFDNALQEINKCLQFGFSEYPYIPGLWAKAQVLERLERRDEARQVYETIHQLYGESNEINYLRQRLKSKLL